MADRVRCLVLASFWVAGLAMLMARNSSAVLAEDPPALNPFDNPGQPPPASRDDKVPGYVELSDGSIHAGMLFLTRDKRLQVLDEAIQRQREVPLEAVAAIECRVKKEWMEKEWKFKETTNDEKMVTGRSYPAREYTYAITLQDGRTIEGSLSGILFLEPPTDNSQGADPAGVQTESKKFLLHKRDKGEMGASLNSLLYVKLVKLGEEAYKEGQEKAAQRTRESPKPDRPAKRKTTAKLH